MALTKPERAIVEAVKNMLDDTALGVDAHKKDPPERAHTFTHMHEEVEQAYRLATIDLTHHDDICSAFSKIHSHKYLDDPEFIPTFEKELTARGMPLKEQTAAIAAIDKTISKLLANTNEKDAGWNPDLEKIIAASQPPQVSEESLTKSAKFFADPRVRNWAKNAIWESIQKTIVPRLAALGYKINTIDEFWTAYDDAAAEFVVRDRMCLLFEDCNSKYNVKP
jgi:hypothetical protein